MKLEREDKNTDVSQEPRFDMSNIDTARFKSLKLFGAISMSYSSDTFVG